MVDVAHRVHKRQHVLQPVDCWLQGGILQLVQDTLQRVSVRLHGARPESLIVVGTVLDDCAHTRVSFLPQILQT